MSLGVSVDLLATVSADVHPSHLQLARAKLGRVRLVRRRASLFFWITGMPYQAASRSGLAKEYLADDYDLVILESEAVAPVLKGLSARDKVALRVHNNESAYFHALARSEKRFAKKAYYFLESLLFRHWSRRVKNRCDYVLHISHREFSREGVGEPSSRVRFLPPHVDAAAMQAPRPKTRGSVLCVGNLFMPNNLQGLLWYLENVHELLRARVPFYKLVVAGNTRGAGAGFLDRYQSVEFHDSPTCLASLYADASVFINPILEGAGVKMRSINAMQQGVPLVSTSVGVEGTGLAPGVHYLGGDTPEEFASAVERLLSEAGLQESIASEAQRYLAEVFDSRALLSELLAS
ncbi:glycosyltransferase family 4 protein [Cognatilysobacter bugurensis]|uniref:glycosyltransferase family 4 protein n=1 Tax=Cognatilysobacter bugurensis TaxID=543356 RepID=UPI001E386756|nr:glycosyltransferase family 4 protein [Lysobacter bugurensis]